MHSCGLGAVCFWIGLSRSFHFSYFPWFKFKLSILLFFWLTSLLYLSNSLCRGCTTHSSATVMLYVLDGVGYFCILSFLCLLSYTTYSKPSFTAQVVNWYFSLKNVLPKDSVNFHITTAIFSPHYLLSSPPTFAEALPPHGPTYCHIFLCVCCLLSLGLPMWACLGGYSRGLPTNGYTTEESSQLNFKELWKTEECITLFQANLSIHLL